MTRRRGPSTSPEAQKRVGEVLRRRQRQHEADVREVLSTPAGRRFLFHALEEVAGVFGVSFTGNNATFFNEGRRSVGVELMQEAQRLAPESYVLALNEALDARRLEAVHVSAAESATSEEDT